METRYTIIKPDGRQHDDRVEWPKDPGYDRIKTLVTPILGGDLEHVSVLHDGKPTDMFVDEEGVRKHLERNDKATAIYRAWWIKGHPTDNPEALSAIYGTAILFHRRVWF